MASALQIDVTVSCPAWIEAVPGVEEVCRDAARAACAANGDGPVVPVAGAGVYDRDPGSWEIGWIAVHPEHRRRGLGEAVTRLALDRALDLPPRTILLYTEDHRLDALRLYLRLGFQPSPRHRSHRRRWQSVGDRLPSEAAALVVSSLQALHEPAKPS